MPLSGWWYWWLWTWSCWSGLTVNCCVSVGAKRGRQWMICEGFQMILKMQADALVTLGVSSRFRVSTRIQVWHHSLVGASSPGPEEAARKLDLCLFFFLSLFCYLLLSFFVGPGFVSDVETVPAEDSPSVHSQTHQDPPSFWGKLLPPCLLTGSSPRLLRHYSLKLIEVDVVYVHKKTNQGPYGQKILAHKKRAYNRIGVHVQMYKTVFHSGNAQCPT